MDVALRTAPDTIAAERIRVRGTVQGVGFRPTVWRIATELALAGTVANDNEGVLIEVVGEPGAIEALVARLSREVPPLARVQGIERARLAHTPEVRDFRIIESFAGVVDTNVAADAAMCAACCAEIFDPFARRYRYPFANCTHCGPRLTILDAVPYDRSRTTMREFVMCEQCRAEYESPSDRRFHAQPIACHTCGPRARLERSDRRAFALDTLTSLDAVDAASTLLRRGSIVAIKGLGGYQLACDATNDAAVDALRSAKRRERKPFALMARDLAMIRAYCEVDERAEALLKDCAAPIVLLDRRTPCPAIAAGVAPGMQTLGFMLPGTGLHHLLLMRMVHPIVLTSGNLTDEPQCIDDEEARTRLGGIAEYFLLHDRAIARRVDDSVVRVMAGESRLLRRARGYAPAPLKLPVGFADAPPLLAMGGELKNTFCLLRDGQAVVSHHMGDLADALTLADYRQSVTDYLRLFEHEPQIIGVDPHPEYLSGKLGRDMARSNGVRLETVQHHHAHVAACLAENECDIDHPPVIGVALDGLGFGADGTFWGGEFLRADYRDCERIGTFKPVAMPGGTQAVYEPWRNTYAHLMAEMGWARFVLSYAELELCQFLQAKPHEVMDSMIRCGVNSPLASSCGRLFDAAAAACGVCRERVQYEGQAAIEFEALVDQRTLVEEDERLAYPFAIPRLRSGGLPYVEPLAMWEALLGDLILQTPVSVIAARFHKGLAMVIVRMVDQLSGDAEGDTGARTVALSGGVFQNRILLEQVSTRLAAAGYRVLVHRYVPSNDGGLALGQAAVAGVRALAEVQAA